MSSGKGLLRCHIREANQEIRSTELSFTFERAASAGKYGQPELVCRLGAQVVQNDDGEPSLQVNELEAGRCQDLHLQVCYRTRDVQEMIIWRPDPDSRFVSGYSVWGIIAQIKSRKNQVPLPEFKLFCAMTV